MGLNGKERQIQLHTGTKCKWLECHHQQRNCSNVRLFQRLCRDNKNTIKIKNDTNLKCLIRRWIPWEQKETRGQLLHYYIMGIHNHLLISKTYNKNTCTQNVSSEWNTVVCWFLLGHVSNAGFFNLVSRQPDDEAEETHMRRCKVQGWICLESRSVSSQTNVSKWFDEWRMDVCTLPV